MEQFLESLQILLTRFGPSAISAVCTLVGGWIAAKIVRGFVDRALRRARIEAALAGFLTTVAYALLMTLVVISSITALGVPTTSFVAVLGAAGLAVGFALQSSLGNLASGVMLIVFRPFKAGDFIEAAGVSGTIEEIQIFATVLKTPDNKRVFVPNSSVTAGTITNYSFNDTRRIDLVFGIGYGDDIKKAKVVLEQVLAADDRVLDEPAPIVALSNLGDSSVEFVVRPWVKREDYWEVACHIREAVKDRFDAEKISIPFPQSDVHLHQVA